MPKSNKKPDAKIQELYSKSLVSDSKDHQMIQQGLDPVINQEQPQLEMDPNFRSIMGS